MNKTEVYGFKVEADTTEAIKNLQAVINELKTIKKLTRPKWYNFWHWFRPVNINISIDSIIPKEFTNEMIKNTEATWDNMAQIADERINKFVKEIHNHIVSPTEM
jgi:hypothetical protein